MTVKPSRSLLTFPTSVTESITPLKYQSLFAMANFLLTKTAGFLCTSSLCLQSLRGHLGGSPPVSLMPWTSGGEEADAFKKLPDSLYTSVSFQMQGPRLQSCPISLSPQLPPNPGSFYCPVHVSQKRKKGHKHHENPAFFKDGSESLGPPEGAKLLDHGSSSSLWPPLRGPRSLKFCLGGAHPPGPLETGSQHLVPSTRTPQPLPATRSPRSGT